MSDAANAAIIETAQALAALYGANAAFMRALVALREGRRADIQAAFIAVAAAMEAVEAPMNNMLAAATRLVG